MRLALMRVLCGTFAAATLLAAASAGAGSTSWTQVGTGSTSGISGAAPAASGWVILRDNKLAGQNRIARLSPTNTVEPLAWPGTDPNDLEAVDLVPGTVDNFAAVTSGGAGFIVRVRDVSVSLVRRFNLPTGRQQNEGFALTTVGSTTVAVWGNRGSSTSPGRLFAARFTPSSGLFGPVVRASVTVPYPASHVRHISDTKILGGRIVISSASDPGDSGPFDSAVYDVGTVTLASGRARLNVTTPRSLGTFPGHKIEAIACSGDAGTLGADDEKHGGWVAPAGFC